LFEQTRNLLAGCILIGISRNAVLHARNTQAGLLGIHKVLEYYFFKFNKQFFMTTSCVITR